MIDTPQRLKEKIELVEALGNIEMAARVIDTGAGSGFDVHPVDLRYKQLGAQLTPVERGGELHVLLDRYLQQTHASTHSTYTLELLQAFEVAREGEAEAFKDVGNRQLLWHGSRLTNWCGILSQGLRIAPPEAPSTGYMFGKGVYFADMVSKSANYCMGSSANPTCVLTLCDVALGEQYERITAEPDAAANTKAKAKHSCFGVGRTCPDAKGTRTLASGARVPMGKGGPNEYLETNLERLKEAEGARAPGLMYNEFIVYDTEQIEMKYVVVFDMDFSIELD